MLYEGSITAGRPRHFVCLINVVLSVAKVVEIFRPESEEGDFEDWERKVHELVGGFHYLRQVGLSGAVFGFTWRWGRVACPNREYTREDGQYGPVRDAAAGLDLGNGWTWFSPRTREDGPWHCLIRLAETHRPMVVWLSYPEEVGEFITRNCISGDVRPYPDLTGTTATFAGTQYLPGDGRGAEDREYGLYTGEPPEHSWEEECPTWLSDDLLLGLLPQEEKYVYRDSIGGEWRTTVEGGTPILWWRVRSDDPRWRRAVSTPRGWHTHEVMKDMEGMIYLVRYDGGEVQAFQLVDNGKTLFYQKNRPEGLLLVDDPESSVAAFAESHRYRE